MLLFNPVDELNGYFIGHFIGHWRPWNTSGRSRSSVTEYRSSCGLCVIKIRRICAKRY